MRKYKLFGNTIKVSLKRNSLCLFAVFVVPVIILVAQSVNAQTVADTDWVGSYYFSDKAQISKRRSRLDVAPVASYDITIEERSGSLVAAFSANGVQLFETYECSVKTAGDKANFYFQSLGSSDVENFRNFKNGDLLFSLVKTPIGKTAKYLFQPAAYKIARASPNKQKRQIYFETP